MTRAFLDTTVIVDVLLKRRTVGQIARVAIRRFGQVLLPIYALKELQLGALSNLVWFHNLCANHRSWAKVKDALVREGRTPRRYKKSTVDEFELEVAIMEKSMAIPPEVSQKYADNPDLYRSDLHRLECLSVVLSAWKRRRTFAENIQVVDEISCFPERSPKVLPNGLIEMSERQCKCDPQVNCALAMIMEGNVATVKRLLRAVTAAHLENPKSEHSRRIKALNKIVRKQSVSNDDCRCLGDAVFAFFAPRDAVILTKNTTDHEPLAASVNKKVRGY